MNIVKRLLGESVEAKELVSSTKPTPILVCPHCQQEVYEKHSYCRDGVDYHSDCGNPIKFPPMSQEDKEALDKWFGH